MPLRDSSFKKCGILTAISSLPSKYGIGCFDDTAYRFIDFLAECKQNYWQILPLCPVGKGNSPYSSISSFAGEILYIDLDALKKEGLIKEIPQYPESLKVDYNRVKSFKYPLIREAVNNFNPKKKEYISFLNDNRHWLNNYAEFMAIREYLGNLPLHKWEDKYKFKLPDAIEKFRTEKENEINFFKISQYFFHKQYKKLKAYANSRDIKIIGDIPFYVSADSADVWGNPDCFMLNRDMTPSLVAGVPPDIFSISGQLWGNPIYNFEYQKSNNYLWWQQRLSHNGEMYNVLRIDHFRAFADYYTVDADAENAICGQWKTGVGIEFWNTVKPAIRECEIIAEDLGGETPQVQELIAKTGFPNMKILQFAFDSDLSDPFLPDNFNENCVCYTGTHDNNTTLGWYTQAEKREKILFDSLIEKNEYTSPVLRLISAGMKSRADTVIIPLQDYMELDERHRMNIPGEEKGNWEWRFCQEDLNQSLIEKIRGLSEKRNYTN